MVRPRRRGVAGSGTAVGEHHTGVANPTQTVANTVARLVIYRGLPPTTQPSRYRSMSHRILFAAVLLPALSSVAAAQPGACEDCYVYGPPVVVAQPGPQVDVMADRLGVGLHAVSLAIANREDPDAEPTHLGGGGLQLRYRLTPRWELELGFSTLRETDEDGMVVDGPEIHTATLGAMFHMRPGRRWDWYLIGAIGGVHVGDR